MYTSTAVHCEVCGATIGVVLPGGYFRSEFRGREFLVYGGDGAYVETTCGARVRGSDRVCGRRHHFSLSQSTPPLASSALPHPSAE
jgi:hypothetical protein